MQTELMPEVPRPEELRHDSWSAMIDRCSLPSPIGPGRVGVWMRLVDDLGDDPILNVCGLAYLSDDLPTDAVIAAHPERPSVGSPERVFWHASLDHVIWFHRPSRANDWHLHDFTCRGLIGTRGLSIGSIFDATGRQVASIAQEILIRSRRGK